VCFVPQLFTALKPAIVYLLGLIMFGMGMTLTPASFAAVLRRPDMVALAVKYFAPAAALPGALFSIWHNLSGAMLASIWRKDAAKDPLA
jgi:predicted Na+-dependent transporter